MAATSDPRDDSGGTEPGKARRQYSRERLLGFSAQPWASTPPADLDIAKLRTAMLGGAQGDAAGMGRGYGGGQGAAHYQGNGYAPGPGAVGRGAGQPVHDAGLPPGWKGDLRRLPLLGATPGPVPVQPYGRGKHVPGGPPGVGGPAGLGAAAGSGQEGGPGHARNGPRNVPAQHLQQAAQHPPQPPPAAQHAFQQAQKPALLSGEIHLYAGKGWNGAGRGRGRARSADGGPMAVPPGFRGPGAPDDVSKGGLQTGAPVSLRPGWRKEDGPDRGIMGRGRGALGPGARLPEGQARGMGMGGGGYPGAHHGGRGGPGEPARGPQGRPGPHYPGHQQRHGGRPPFHGAEEDDAGTLWDTDDGGESEEARQHQQEEARRKRDEFERMRQEMHQLAADRRRELDARQRVARRGDADEDILESLCGGPDSAATVPVPPRDGEDGEEEQIMLAPRAGKQLAMPAAGPAVPAADRSAGPSPAPAVPPGFKGSGRGATPAKPLEVGEGLPRELKAPMGGAARALDFGAEEEPKPRAETEAPGVAGQLGGGEEGGTVKGTLDLAELERAQGIDAYEPSANTADRDGKGGGADPGAGAADGESTVRAQSWLSSWLTAPASEATAPEPTQPLPSAPGLKPPQVEGGKSESQVELPGDAAPAGSSGPKGGLFSGSLFLPGALFSSSSWNPAAPAASEDSWSLPVPVPAPQSAAAGPHWKEPSHVRVGSTADSASGLEVKVGGARAATGTAESQMQGAEGEPAFSQPQLGGPPQEAGAMEVAKKNASADSGPGKDAAAEVGVAEILKRIRAGTSGGLAESTAKAPMQQELQPAAPDQLARPDMDKGKAGAEQIKAEAREDHDGAGAHDQATLEAMLQKLARRSTVPAPLAPGPAAPAAFAFPPASFQQPHVPVQSGVGMSRISPASALLGEPPSMAPGGGAMGVPAGGGLAALLSSLQAPGGDTHAGLDPRLLPMPAAPSLDEIEGLSAPHRQPHQSRPMGPAVPGNDPAVLAYTSLEDVERMMLQGGSSQGPPGQSGPAAPGAGARGAGQGAQRRSQAQAAGVDTVSDAGAAPEMKSASLQLLSFLKQPEAGAPQLPSMHPGSQVHSAGPSQHSGPFAPQHIFPPFPNSPPLPYPGGPLPGAPLPLQFRGIPPFHGGMPGGLPFLPPDGAHMALPPFPGVAPFPGPDRGGPVQAIPAHVHMPGAPGPQGLDMGAHGPAFSESAGPGMGPPRPLLGHPPAGMFPGQAPLNLLPVLFPGQLLDHRGGSPAHPPDRGPPDGWLHGGLGPSPGGQALPGFPPAPQGQDTGPTPRKPLVSRALFPTDAPADPAIDAVFSAPPLDHWS